MRFSFQDVVLLRTAFQLQSAKIPARRIHQALSRLKEQMPEDTPLSGVRLRAVDDAVVAQTGHTQWDASSGQLLFDFGEPDVARDVIAMENAPANRAAREKQAQEWYVLAEHLQETDPEGAEKAYRKALELSPEPHYRTPTRRSLVRAHLLGKRGNNLPSQNALKSRVGLIRARRRIDAGEELSIDYALVGDEKMSRALRERYACHCGARQCRGSMIA